MSGIVNKIKDVLHHDKSSSTTHSGTAEGVAGPHGSRAANAADPRIDSDMDGSRHTGATTGTTGGLTGTHGTHTTGTTSTGYGASNSTAGPHSSNMANKVDPRVDSDLDGSRNMGAASGTTGGYSSGTSGLTGTSHGTSGLTGSNHGSSGLTGTNHGTTGIGNSSAHTSSTTSTTPHNSNLLNKVDPRVDSTTSGAYSGTHAGNTGTTGTHSGTGAFSGTGTTGGLSNSSNAGPHNSSMANKADPRVDSDLDGRGNRHGASHGGILGASGSHATAGSGTAQNTAGPHNSDMLNKVDPRVDSDRDGSKTYMGNQTHA
ncbi:hypothetical protein M7I_5663 [Glarea lozoyensis 74030]|nr:hypothetical protein M7I_5663 [Glarea lozoyensis 74030]